MTKELKEEIEDTKRNHTVGMKRMTGDLKKEIKDVNENQAKGMKEMTKDLKEEIQLGISVLGKNISDWSQSVLGARPTKRG